MTKTTTTATTTTKTTTTASGLGTQPPERDDGDRRRSRLVLVLRMSADGRRLQFTVIGFIRRQETQGDPLRCDDDDDDDVRHSGGPSTTTLFVQLVTTSNDNATKNRPDAWNPFATRSASGFTGRYAAAVLKTEYKTRYTDRGGGRGSVDSRDEVVRCARQQVGPLCD